MARPTMAAVQGFEPQLLDSESSVLPLDDTARQDVKVPQERHTPGLSCNLVKDADVVNGELVMPNDFRCDWTAAARFDY